MNHTDDRTTIWTTTILVGGMSCGSCVRHVARALDGLSGVIDAAVDLTRGEATVEHLVGCTDAAALVAAIRDAGYQARVGVTRPAAAAIARIEG